MRRCALPSRTRLPRMGQRTPCACVRVRARVRAHARAPNQHCCLAAGLHGSFTHDYLGPPPGTPDAAPYNIKSGL